jgi:hypothetical protein
MFRRDPDPEPQTPQAPQPSPGTACADFLIKMRIFSQPQTPEAEFPLETPNPLA